jgi:hypothetical protein
MGGGRPQHSAWVSDLRVPGSVRHQLSRKVMHSLAEAPYGDQVVFPDRILIEDPDQPEGWFPGASWPVLVLLIENQGVCAWGVFPLRAMTILLSSSGVISTTAGLCVPMRRTSRHSWSVDDGTEPASIERLYCRRRPRNSMPGCSTFCEHISTSALRLSAGLVRRTIDSSVRRRASCCVHVEVSAIGGSRRTRTMRCGRRGA